MTGKEIYDTIGNTSYNLALFHFAKIMKDEMCSETMAVGSQLILVDTDLIAECNNGEELRKVVLEKAESEGQYAGMEYVETEFLDEENPLFESADCGLSWCCFDDLWNALEKTAKEIQADC